MQEYLQKTPLGAIMDEIGVALMLLLGSLLFFFLLWGVTLPALIAGVAAFLLWMLLRARTRDERLRRREARLRQRIGGELQLESWTVCAPRRAHFETALLLSGVCPLTLERSLEEGVLCTLRDEGEKLLVACAQLHRADRLAARDIAAFQRACLRAGASRGALCGAAGASAPAREQAALAPRVSFIDREQMIALAGAASPASDRQLVALSGRRRTRHTVRSLRDAVLSARRAKRYLLYGLLLMIFYIATGRRYYPLPGLICLLLMTLCRLRRARKGSEPLM